MWTLAECGHFIQWSASWQTASCHQMSGRNVISPILPSWPNPIIENLKVPWNAQNWPSMAILSNHLLHGTMYHPTKFQANNWNTLRLRAVTFSLGPVPSLFWKFQSAVERAKNGWAWPFYIAICFMLLCIIPPNFRLIPAILRVRVVITSSLRPGQKSL